jgi:hypothetical protein
MIVFIYKKLPFAREAFLFLSDSSFSASVLLPPSPFQVLNGK